MNRSDFRKGGLQGRKHSEFIPAKRKRTIHPDLGGGLVPEGEWKGLRRRSFLGGTPAISHVPTALRRASGRVLRGMRGEPVRRVGRNRIKRQNARARAAW